MASYRQRRNAEIIFTQREIRSHYQWPPAFYHREPAKNNWEPFKEMRKFTPKEKDNALEYFYGRSNSVKPSQEIIDILIAEGYMDYAHQ